MDPKYQGLPGIVTLNFTFFVCSEIKQFCFEGCWSTRLLRNKRSSRKWPASIRTGKSFCTERIFVFKIFLFQETFDSDAIDRNNVDPNAAAQNFRDRTISSEGVGTFLRIAYEPLLFFTNVKMFRFFGFNRLSSTEWISHKKICVWSWHRFRRAGNTRAAIYPPKNWASRIGSTGQQFKGNFRLFLVFFSFSLMRNREKKEPPMILVCVFVLAHDLGLCFCSLIGWKIIQFEKPYGI